MHRRSRGNHRRGTRLCLALHLGYHGGRDGSSFASFCDPLPYRFGCLSVDLCFMFQFVGVSVEEVCWIPVTMVFDPESFLGVETSGETRALTGQFFGCKFGYLHYFTVDVLTKEH